MELGCSTLLFGDHPLDVTLKTIAAAGYKAIELCSIPGMAVHIQADTSGSDCKAIKDLCAKHGLAIESIGASSDLLNPDGKKRFMDLMEKAALIGAPAVTSGAGGKSDDEESFKTVVKNFESLAQHAKKTGVKISIKPHVRTAVYDTPTSLRFMKEVDAKWIGINLDGSHIWRTPKLEDPAESVRQLAKYIFTGRIRDTLSREIPIGPVETQIPGGGAMDLKAVCNEFKKVPGLRYLTLEIVGMKGYTIEQCKDVVARCMAGLKPLCM